MDYYDQVNGTDSWPASQHVTEENLTKVNTGIGKLDTALGLLGQGVGGFILQNADGTYGAQVTIDSGLTASISPFRAIIGGKIHELTSPVSQAFTATKAALLYATKQTAVGNLVPTIGKIDAVFPAANGNSVNRYIFNQANPVDMVGGNDITTVVDCTDVDGWIDQAKEGNGTSSYMQSSGSAGITGANARTEIILYTPRALTGTTIRYIKTYGNYSLYTEGTRLKVKEQANIRDTGYDLEVDKKHLIYVRYDGAVLDVFAGRYGETVVERFRKVYSLTTTFNSTAGNLYFLRNSSAANYNAAIIDFYDLKNVALSDDVIYEAANQLLFPCEYTVDGVSHNIITDVLPTNSIALAMVNTNATDITDISDANWAYGRREGIENQPKRPVFLGWRSVSLSTYYDVTNPFFGSDIKAWLVYKKNLTDVSMSLISEVSSSQGARIKAIYPEKISFFVPNAYVISNRDSYTNNDENSGYIGVYAELI
jgi:hypothetical protein